jgi:hypothetical protein
MEEAAIKVSMEFAATEDGEFGINITVKGKIKSLEKMVDPEWFAKFYRSYANPDPSESFGGFYKRTTGEDLP